MAEREIKNPEWCEEILQHILKGRNCILESAQLIVEKFNENPANLDLISDEVLAGIVQMLDDYNSDTFSIIFCELSKREKLYIFNDEELADIVERLDDHNSKVFQAASCELDKRKETK